MFDSVLDRGVIPNRKLGTGAVISVLAHGVVLALALTVRPPARQPNPEKTLPTVILPPVLSDPPEFVRTNQPPPARPRRGAKSLLMPAAVPARPPPEVEPPPDLSPPKPDTRGHIGDLDPDGPPGDGPDTGGPGGPGGGGRGGGSCEGDTCKLFEAGRMTRPVLLDRGRDPAYTLEALEARVQGKMTVQCVVTLEGRLEQCRVIRPVPLMERAVVEALMSRRYAPATEDGKPLAVRYTFQVQLVLPH